MKFGLKCGKIADSIFSQIPLGHHITTYLRQEQLALSRARNKVLSVSMRSLVALENVIGVSKRWQTLYIPFLSNFTDSVFYRVSV